MTHIHIVLGDETLPTGDWVRALHDFETQEYYRADWGYRVPRSLFSDTDKLDNYKGYPEMLPFRPRVGVKLTEALQWFWFDQLRLSAGYTMTEDDLKEAWRGLTKGHTAFANGRGTDTCWDYITPANEGSELPILWENTCGGSLLELDSIQVYSWGGGTWFKVKTMDPDKLDDYKTWNFRSHPQFFTLGTNSVPLGYNREWTKTGPWRVDAFHYLKGRDVPVPIFSADGFTFVSTRRVRLLRQGDKFPPRAYVP